MFQFYRGESDSFQTHILTCIYEKFIHPQYKTNYQQLMATPVSRLIKDQITVTNVISSI